MEPRYLVLAAAIAGSTALLAQPSLDATNNVPSAGSEYPMSSGAIIPPGGTGAGITYGFWSLVGAGNRDFFYLAPSVTPTSALIPSAQLLSTDGGSDTLFWAVTNDGLTQVGEKTGLGTINYTDPILEIKYPCALGTTWTDNLSATYTVPGAGIQVTRVGTVTGNADGYGTLQLPAVEIQNVLRVVVDKNIQDQSAFANVSRVSRTYYFFTELVPHPVLRLQIDSVTFGGGAPAVSTEALWMYGDGNVSVQELDPNDIRFIPYPNPAADVVHLSFGADADAARFIEVIDATGRLALRKDILVRGTQDMQAAFNVSGLGSGLYFVRLIGEQGVLGTQRLVVR
jgi:hypothetical protein